MEKTRIYSLCLLLAAGLLAGSCTQMERESEEIRFRVEGWREAVKAASLYGGGSLSAGRFKLDAYNHGATSVYISGAELNYSTGAWEWTDGPCYWPLSGALDFYAQMPVTLPSYISDFTYALPAGPGFSCTGLPLTSATQDGLQEYVYAYEANCSKAGGEVVLSFRHPFVVISMALADTYRDITLNSVTFRSVKNSGTYTHAGGWSGQSGSGDLVLSFNRSCASALPSNVFLVLPQVFSGGRQIVVVNYTKGGVASSRELMVSLASWDAGKHYTYNINLAAPEVLTAVGEGFIMNSTSIVCEDIDWDNEE
ncbi:MAG: fimbrillin family protein [Bacteroidales bacterium]|nr:fimbrillin family protein [Bacteroidales bacterium]